MSEDITYLRPQPGFQREVLSCPADIAIVGGAAGAGKTFVMLLESMRNIEVPGFGAVFFRRTTPQIRNQGALLDSSRKVYVLMGGRLRDQQLEWVFSDHHGNKIKFAHLQHEKDAEEWQGTEIPLIIFDELTHFTEYQFWYLLSRNRSTCGVAPYVRATCNPDADSWVASLIEYYIDQETGYAIPERSGQLRYFIRLSGIIIWGDSKAEVFELIKDNPAFVLQAEKVKKIGLNPLSLIRSFTFIPGDIYSNAELLSIDPGYLGNLMALPEEQQKQLLSGNWKISQDGLAICNYNMLVHIFDNFPDNSERPLKCITCDAARYGRDLCVIFVWRGWEVIHIVVFIKSDINDIKDMIEKLRRKYNVQKFNVMVDQDGVGGGVVKMGDYQGFHALDKAKRDPATGTLENYKNFKTQCAYRFCELRVNVGQVLINVTSENCEVYDNGTIQTHNPYTMVIKMNGKMTNIRTLILEDLKSIKRADPDAERKIQMIDKEAQKILLKRSPDFGDNCIMREALELTARDGGLTRRN